MTESKAKACKWLTVLLRLNYICEDAFEIKCHWGGWGRFRAPTSTLQDASLRHRHPKTGTSLASGPINLF